MNGAGTRQWRKPARSAHVLVALVQVHARDGRATTRAVAGQARVSLVACHRHLRTLREHGLVTWEPGKAGTFRPFVYRVPVAVGSERPGQ